MDTHKPTLSKPSADTFEKRADQQLKVLPIEYLQPGAYQPRRVFNSQKLEELARSIQSEGLIEPVVVRPISTGRYEIIAGERRWRAAQRAGLHEVTCLIRESSDETAAKLGLLENIQREDLNSIEEAEAFLRLQREFGLSHEAISQAIAKSRPYVTNALRLLKLPESIQAAVLQGQLSSGHGKVLAGLGDAALIRQWGESCLRQKWPVERLVSEIKRAERGSDKAKSTTGQSPDMARLERLLSEQLGAPLSITHHPSGCGELRIKYHDLEELEGVLEKLPIDLKEL